MKRFLVFILIISMTIENILVLTGCENKQLEIMTKGQWAQKIAEALQLDYCEITEPVYEDVKSDNTYFDAVQNCVAWDIFDKTDNFEPDSEATINFAIVSAIKAVGEDKIAKSSYNKVLQTEDDRIEFFNNISDMNYISGGALYPEWADSVIADMKTIISSLELQQFEDIELKEQCVEVGEQDVIFSADGSTGTIQSDTLSIKKGNILLINPSQIYPEGKTAKITELKENKFTYIMPSPEEVFEHIEVSGTYRPQIIGVIPMSDDVEIEGINGNKAIPQRCPSTSAHAGKLMYIPEAKAGKLEAETSLEDIQISLLDSKGKKGSAKGSVSGSVGIKNIKVTADIDSKGISINKACAQIDSTMNANFHAEGSYIPKTIPLVNTFFSIAGAMTLQFQANMTIGASGDITIDWSMPTTIGVEYKKGSGARFLAETEGSNLSAEAHAEAYMTPGLKGIFKVFGFSVASCGAYSGIQVKLDAKAETKKAYSCINLKGYVPLSCFAGGEGEETLLGKLGIKKSWTVWDENSSRLKKEWHIENGKVVKECTHPEDANKESIKQDEYEKIELPPLELPTFEDFSNYYFGITVPFVVLKENTSDRLSFKIPDGYSMKDIVCSSEGISVASITNDGIITANGVGVTQMRIATKDNKYFQYIVVNVSSDYSVDFTPL